MQVLKRCVIGPKRGHAQSLRRYGLIFSIPVAFVGSRVAKAS